MLTIKSVYVGNENEAYIENRFRDGLNVVFSDDNHMGKTVVMQSLMYALGGYAGFPPSFNSEDYYHIVDFEVGGKFLSVLRRKDSFAILQDEDVYIAENAAEFRDFWNSKISPLPMIIKDGRVHRVYLALFNQLFFVPQSDRSSSRTVNPGQYHKKDFTEMIASIAGASKRVLDEGETVRLKQRKEELRFARDRVLREMKAFNCEDGALSVISTVADAERRDKVFRKIENLQESIGLLQRERNKRHSKKLEYSNLLSELRSLKRAVGSGELVCLDCGGSNIGYRVPQSKMTFDVTTPKMRSSIERSVSDKIDACDDEIFRIDEEITSKQAELSRLLEGNNFTVREVMAYQGVAPDIAVLNKEFSNIERDLSDVDAALAASQEKDKAASLKYDELMFSIVSVMNDVYKYFGEDELKPYEKIMTPNDSPFKGSEETEYFLSRCYALEKILHHGFPIVIDSFRAEDLSTRREDGVLTAYKSLRNQVILTTTVKREEHNKYLEDPDINAIDYSSFQTRHILQPDYVPAFLDKLESFGVVLFVE